MNIKQLVQDLLAVKDKAQVDLSEAEEDLDYIIAELEKAHTQCHECFNSWNYRGKQDCGWCYMFREYMPNCEKYRDQ